jgi:redox-sensitive bicupin YhaK (pirin superfamily)
LKVIHKSEHRTLEYDWLKTTHHFSFGEYHDPQRMSFGPLRVFNDDTIKPGAGFDFHQHHDMEIVTYVIEGTLEHKDNFGNRGIISPGEIQTMSAGTGVFHSEYNHSSSQPLRLLQMWIFADRQGLKPSWGQQKFTKQERQNILLPVISPKRNEKSLSVHQDVSFFVSSINQNNTVRHKLQDKRQAYLYAITGSIQVNDEKLDQGDSAEIKDPEILITAVKDSEIILIDVPVQYVKNGEPST